MKHGGERDRPTKAVTTPFECCTNEESIAQVVEEITYQHTRDDTGPYRTRYCRGQPLLGFLFTLFTLFHRSFVRLLRLVCLRRLCLRQPRHHTVYQSRQQEPSEDHCPPPPHRVHLLCPAHSDQMRGLKEQQKERAREDCTGCEACEDPLKLLGVCGRHFADPRHKENDTGQGHDVDDRRGQNDRTPWVIFLLLLR